MKKILIILFITSFFLLSSCFKNDEIKEIKNNITQENNNFWTVLLWEKSCWEKTCNLQEYLQNLKLNWKISKEAVKNMDYYQKRLWFLLDKYKEKNILLKAQDYQKFVDDFYEEFFPCEYVIKICDKVWKYFQDEQNYFLYIYLPWMVAEETLEKRWWNGQDYDDLTQSIKRKYYLTDYEKEAWMKLRKEKLIKKVQDFDFNNIDKEKLKIDENYFKEIILMPEIWLYDYIISLIPTPITRPTIEQLQYARNLAINLFFTKLSNLWIQKEYFYEIIWTSQENFEKLNKELNIINNKYSLINKIPLDRYLTHAEIVKFFMLNESEFNQNWNFRKDMLTIRHYILLQYAYENEDLWNMITRSSYYNSKYNFLWENILKYSKHMDKNIFNY